MRIILVAGAALAFACSPAAAGGLLGAQPLGLSSGTRQEGPVPGILRVDDDDDDDDRRPRYYRRGDRDDDRRRYRAYRERDRSYSRRSRDDDDDDD